jgi:hypothetical protein
VIRLHNELRAEADDRGVSQAAPPFDTATPARTASDPPAPDGAVPAAYATPPPAPDTGAATAPDVPHPDGVLPATTHTPRTFEPPAEAASTPQAVVPPAAGGGGWARALRRPPVVAAAVLVLALAGYALFLRAQVRAGLRDAAARAEAAERGAAATRQEAQEQIAAVQRAAEAQLASLQDATASAQLLTAVAAAPDLVRMALVPRGGAGPGVQVLWSRTHGAAVSSVRLPAPPQGRAYQLWLLTRSGPVAVGAFAPANGRASAVFESPAGLPRPVIGAAITLEAAGGSRQPSGAYLYSTVPATPSAS